MANIYNDSSEVLRQISGNINGNFSNLTVDNLIANNAAIDNLNVDNTAVLSSLEISNLNNHNLLVAGINGAINGLAIGNNNEVLISDGLDAVWSNSLTVNTLTTNSLTIPSTVEGDILVFNNSSEAQRLVVGASGQFLISDGVNPTWNNLPDPLILGGLQVNSNFELTSFTNKTLITNNSGFIVSENIMYNNGSATINTTPSQIYSNLTWTFTNGAWYNIKVQINNGLQSIIGLVKIDTTIIGYVNCLASNTWYCEFTYNHTGPTGLNAMVLTDFNTPAGSSNITYSIKVERAPIPTFVL